MVNGVFYSVNFVAEFSNRVGQLAKTAIEIVFLRFSKRIAEQLDVFIETVDCVLGTHGGIVTTGLS